MKLSALLLCLISLKLITSDKAHAATLLNVSDTVSTSRPSASAPLFEDQTLGATSATVLDNQSFYLPGDIATLRADTSETANTATVSSSISQSTTPKTKVVNFSSSIPNSHHKGDALMTPILAIHTISFKAATAVPASGRIVIKFPPVISGDANNSASPSASTFQLNNLSDATVKVVGLSGAGTISGTYTNPTASGQSPTIQLALTGTTTITAGATITIFLGCTEVTATNCTKPSPKIINPTYTETLNKADIWTVLVKTQDTASKDIDTSKAKIATPQGVEIRAKVAPSLTLSLAGLNDGVSANTANPGCQNTETTNSGSPSSPTAIDLDLLKDTPSKKNTKVGNLSGQLLSVTTNVKTGYSLSATANGPLQNAATGFSIPSSTIPKVFPKGKAWFGLHPCGKDVSVSSWIQPSAQSCNTYTSGSSGNVCKYGWPTSSIPITLATSTTGPIGTTASNAATGSGITSVQFAAGVDSSVPAGLYSTILTYLATILF